MGLPDPDLDSIAERIAEGREPTRDEVASVRRGAAKQGIANNLVVLAEISRFHRMVHGGAAPTMPAVEPSGTMSAPDHWGSLQLRGRLGRGGFGEVYRAWDPSLQREVALKLFRADLDPAGHASQQLLHEARLLAGVRHQNVVAVHGVESHGGRHGYWMELVQGKDIEQGLREQGPMSAEEAAHVGMTLCKALSAVHAAGLVHRDIKTTNVMRERGGRLVLMDFGSVAPASLEGVATGRAERVSGTPVYMSPETLRGAAPAKASDIYALGVLLYRLVTGAYPVEALSVDELRNAHDAGRRRLLRDARPDLPHSFCAVVDRALHPDPGERFATAGELEQALAGASRPTAVLDAAAAARGFAPVPDLAAARDVATAPKARPSRRRASARVGVAVLIVAVVAVAAVLAGRGGWLRSAGGAHIVVDARFFSLKEGRTLPLSDGATVAVGDPIWLELQSSREAYVYVLNRDENGEVNLLFPLATYDLQNPLPAGAAHQLPGRAAGVRKAWQVSSRGGQEEFVVVASPRRLSEFEQSLASLPQAGSDEGRVALALGRAQVDQLVRGTAGTTELPEATAGGAGGLDIFAAAERLGTAGSDARGIWVRKLVLENPR